MTAEPARGNRVQRALVTGATGGIGLAVAEVLNRSGFEVFGTYRKDHPHVDFVQEWTKLDLSSAESVKSLDIDLLSFDVLVSNAGQVETRPFQRSPDELFRDLYELHVVSAAALARQVIPGMLRRKFGRIIFMSSVGGFVGDRGLTAYAASKTAQLGLARSIAREYAQKGITANVVAPGLIETKILDRMTPQILNGHTARIPASRLGRPEEVGAAVCFLASAHASYINGVLLPVDGGLSMGT